MQRGAGSAPRAELLALVHFARLVQRCEVHFGRIILGALWSLAALVLVPGVTETARAHWIGPSQASAAPTVMEVRVEQGRVEVDLEIDEGDLEHFRDLLDAERFEAVFGADPEGMARRRTRFFARSGVRVREGSGGAPVSGRVIILEERDRVAGYLPSTLDGVILPERSPRVVFARVIYPLHDSPSSIVISPPPVDGEERARLNIGFITLHLGMPTHDFDYLRRPETLNLDWRDAWHSRYENGSLRRHHRSPVLDYVYVDDFEVRREIVVRVRDLAEWLRPSVADPETIAPAEREAVARQVGELMLAHSPVAIDGEPVELTLDRADYIDIGLRGIASDRGDGPVPMARATVGLILSRPVAGLPGALETRWELFNETITEVPTSMVDPVPSSPVLLRAEAPTLSWRNQSAHHRSSSVEATAVDAVPVVIRVPLLAGVVVLVALITLVHLWRRRDETWEQFVIASVGALLAVVFASALGGTTKVDLPMETQVTADPERARLALSGVLENVYRAFEAREEGDVRERLAVSVEGEQLQAIYLEQRRAFAMEREGGEVAEVDRVELMGLEELRVIDGSLSMRARWLASGAVGHWGHTHRRTNRYVARLKLSPVHGVWKLSAFDVEEVERLR